MRLLYYSLYVVTTCLLLQGCGGGSPSISQPPTQPVSVTITPTTATVSQGASIEFFAIVLNTTNQQVIWSIREGSSGGTISNTGIYRAPNTIVGSNSTFTVVATSAADPTKSASAKITIRQEIIIFPKRARANWGSSIIFNFDGSTIPYNDILLRVLNSDNDGTIHGNTYIAPIKSGSFSVRAYWALDPNIYTDATVDVDQHPIPRIEIVDNGRLCTNIFTNDNLTPSEKTKLKILIHNSNETDVLWEIKTQDPNPIKGHITSDGEYTAPSANDFTGDFTWENVFVSLKKYPSISTYITITTKRAALLIEPEKVFIKTDEVFKFGTKKFPDSTSEISFFLTLNNPYALPKDELDVITGTISSDGIYTAPSFASNVLIGANYKINQTNISGTSRVFTNGRGPFVHHGNLSKTRQQVVAEAFSNNRIFISEWGDDTYEIYNTSTGLIEKIDYLDTVRSGGTITKLPDGQLVFIGGQTSGIWYAMPNYGFVREISIFNGSDLTFRNISNLNMGRKYHTTTVLKNGKLLITGGQSENYMSITSSAEIYDPLTNTCRTINSMNLARAAHSATVLHNGKVLIAGGWTTTAPSSTSTDTAEIFDPVTETFQNVGKMLVARSWHSESLLSDGKVLATGGYPDSSNCITNAELFDPVTNQWSAAGLFRFYHGMGHGSMNVNANETIIVGGNYQLGVCELYNLQKNEIILFGSAFNAPSYWYNVTKLIKINNEIFLIQGSFIEKYIN